MLPMIEPKFDFQDEEWAKKNKLSYKEYLQIISIFNANFVEIDFSWGQQINQLNSIISSLHPAHDLNELLR